MFKRGLIMKDINNYSFKNKNILLRVDLNVPVVDGVVTDLSRINSIKSTIFKLINSKNKIFIISHFGRPKGRYIKKYSLKFLCSYLEKEFSLKKIHFLNNFDTDKISKMQNFIEYGEVCLFENIRFHEGEEKNDLNFSKYLSTCFDIYVNDAFSASHRKHSSIVGITKFLPSIAGDSLLTEIKNLDLFLNNTIKPNTAIIGVSKISTKIDVVEYLIQHFDNIIFGCAMANTFLFAKGINIF